MRLSKILLRPSLLPTLTMLRVLAMRLRSKITQGNQLTTITIGTNVRLGANLLDGIFGAPANNLFRDAYLVNGAGTYKGTRQETGRRQTYRK